MFFFFPSFLCPLCPTFGWSGALLFLLLIKFPFSAFITYLHCDTNFASLSKQKQFVFFFPFRHWFSYSHTVNTPLLIFGIFILRVYLYQSVWFVKWCVIVDLFCGVVTAATILIQMHKVKRRKSRVFFCLQ